MDIRSIALNVYQKSLDSAYAGSISDQELKELSPQENAFIKRLVLTALRRQEFIKSIIRNYAAKKIPSRPDIPHLAIILGAVEILYFRTPDYATVNSYVELAKKKGNKYCGGFVNAVLHKICRDKEQIAARTRLPFFPAAFNEILRADYTAKKIAALEQASQEEPALDITVKEDPEGWSRKLNGQLTGNGSVRLRSAGNVTELPGYAEGHWWVQDLASSLAVTALGDVRDKSVLDICAAPGGKTAQLIAKKAVVTALDISASRLDTMRENLQRLGLQASRIVCADALEYLKNAPQYPIVLLDAPCSATGTLRRHPEIVHTRTRADVVKNSEVQRQMLEAAAPSVAEDGLLLYAVCSLSKAEGEQQIGRFLDSHPDFTICKIDAEEINPYGMPGFEELITPEGYIRCLPDLLGGMDGFFVARLQKSSSHKC